MAQRRNLKPLLGARRISLMILAALALVAFQAPAPPADSYADSATARLVALARAARDRNERLVTAYTAQVSQRIGVGIRALSRDRMLYRQEVTARIDWRRDSRSTIEVTGLRQAVPVINRGDEVPEDLDSHVRWLVVNPAQDYLVALGDDDDGFVYPLRVGGEADYRFSIGDTTRIDLPSGRAVRLVELRITPRRADWQLMSGSLWFDADSYGLVRAVFRPARPYEFRRDADPDDQEDVPSFVNGTGEIKFITMEYGLYEDRWWMLRYVALEGVGSMGKWLGVPVRFERVYSDYEVQGGTPPVPGSTFRPAGTIRGDEERRDSADRRRDTLTREQRRARADSIQAQVEECVRRAWPEDRATPSRQRIRVELSGNCWREVRGDTALQVVAPDDPETLRTSPTLGEPILQMGDLITEAELRGLADAIQQLPAAPLGRRVEFPTRLTSLLRIARYNRVEALSIGPRATVAMGRAEFDGEARIGLADLEPNFEAGASLLGRSTRIRLGGYRRLAAANPDTRPFGPVNSAAGLLLQRDDGEYFRTTGVELTGTNTTTGWLGWRLYAERQREAATETDFSLPHLFDGTSSFRPNITADRADQVGGAITLRGTRAISRSLLVGMDLNVDGETGDFEFGRGAATVRAIITPPGPWAVAIEGAAGTSRGTIPVQGRFYLGGPSSLRGYTGGVIAGEAFWRARAEVGNAFPAARLTAFADLGWAGTRSAFGRGRPLLGAGVGGSFFDGLVRLDLARAMRGPTGWRFDLYFDGRL